MRQSHRKARRAELAEKRKGSDWEKAANAGVIPKDCSCVQPVEKDGEKVCANCGRVLVEGERA